MAERPPLTVEELRSGRHVRRGRTPGAVECVQCGGSYAPLQAGGVLYFHACPPLSEPDVAKYEARGIFGLRPGDLRPEHRNEAEFVSRESIPVWRKFLQEF